MVCRLGAYVRAPPGLFKDTISHSKAAVLLNSMVEGCCPDFRWTSISVQCNLCSPQHRDTLNAAGSSCVIQLSCSEGGQVWIEGGVYQEVQRKTHLLAGRLHHVLGSATATQQWQVFVDRIALITYTAGGWQRVTIGTQQRLEALGFRLPCNSCMPNVSVLPPQFSVF